MGSGGGGHFWSRWPGPPHTQLWFQGQMQATPECFAHLTQLLQTVAKGRVCAMLEVTVASREGAGARG